MTEPQNKPGFLNSHRLQHPEENVDNIKENILKVIEDYKNNLNENIQSCNLLEEENHSLEKSIEYIQELRNEVIKNVMKNSELTNAAFETISSLFSMVQICEKYQTSSESLRQQISNKNLKLDEKSQVRENEYTEQINSLQNKIKYLNTEYSNITKNFEIANNERAGKKIHKYRELNDLKTEIKLEEEIEINVLHDKKSVEDETNLICNEFLAFENNFENSKQKAQVEISNLENLKSQLESTLSENEIQIFNLEKERNDLQTGAATHKEFLKEQINNKNSLELIIEDLDKKCVLAKETLNTLAEDFKKERQGFQIEENTLIEKLEELEIEFEVIKGENNVIKKEISNVNDEIDATSATIEEIEEIVTQSEIELNQQQQQIEEQNDKFNIEIELWENILEEDSNLDIKMDKEKELQTILLSKLNEEEQNLNIQLDALSADADVMEIEINLEMDSTKEEKNLLLKKIEDFSLEMDNVELSDKTKLKQTEEEYNEKLKKMSDELIQLKKDLTNRNQFEEKLNNEELKKLKDANTRNEFKMSELTVAVENLEKELELKNTSLKQMKSNQTMEFKKPVYDFNIPISKIPVSKYSSTTSFSDSSVEEIPLTKRRRLMYKRRLSDKKNVNALLMKKKNPNAELQQNVEELFKSLGSPSRNNSSSTRSSRKRSIKKLVF